MHIRTGDPLTCPELIGRDAYVARFDDAFASVLRGSGRVITIAGEAGIGKSRLTATLAARAKEAAPDARILQGNCFEHDARVPFAPLVDLWRSFALTTSDDELRGAFGAHADAAAALLPELRQAPPPAEGAGLRPEQERHALFQALLHPIIGLARSAPLVVVIEDLHWSDETSLDFLLLLARRLHELRIALVLTYRSDEVPPSLAHFLSELDRARLALDLALDRLSAADVSRMVQEIVGPDAALSQDIVNAIRDLTDGNPFFIEEVLKSLSIAGAGAWQPADRAARSAPALQIPRSVHDVVRQRTAALSDGAQALLVHAAVAGRRFELGLLGRLIGAEETQILASVKELIAAQLVVEESAERFAFRHALTQQAIYSTLLLRERRALHLEIAKTLEGMGAEDGDARVAELAHHYFEAEDWEHAFEYAWRAGDAAQQLFSPRAAVQQFTRALAAAEHAGRAAPGTIFSARGRAHDALGDFGAAREDHESALRIARSTSDVPGEWRALIDLGFLWSTRDYDRAGDLFRRALDLARAGDDPAMLGRSLNRFGNWLVNVGRTTEGIEQHRTALRIFTEAHDRAGEAETHDLLGMALGQAGALDECIAEYGKAVDLLSELGDEQRLTSALASRTTYASPVQAETVPAARCALEDVRRDGEAAMQLATKSGSSVGTAYAHWTLASALGSFGLLGEGIALATEGLRIALEVRHEQWMAGGYFTLGLLHWHALDEAEAIRELEAGLPIASQLKSAWWMGNIGAYLGLAHIAARDRASAHAALDAAPFAGDDVATLPARRINWARAELLLADNRPSDALALAERLLGSGACASAEHLPPPVLVTAGRAHLAIGDAAGASAAVERAVASAEASGDLPWLWRARCFQAELLARSGRIDDARDACADARRLLARLADGLADDERARFVLAAERRVPQVRPPTAREAARQASEGLTEREREIAGLVALGQSNREIAETLVLSERTVETHVGHILGKLGFSSRAQIAAWHAERIAKDRALSAGG